jgi:hypothetical protein
VSQYQVSKLLRDVARDAEIARRCRADISAVLANYDLNEIEQDAIKNGAFANYMTWASTHYSC